MGNLFLKNIEICKECGRFKSKQSSHKCPEINPFKGKKHKEETLELLKEKCGMNPNSMKTRFKEKHIVSKKFRKNQSKILKKIWEQEKSPYKNPKRNKKISLAFTLDKHPNWLGGKSFEPYTPEFNKEFKNLVRLRDNFCCLNCGISEQKHLVLIGRKLTIHHIDYDKKNTCLVNCCSLCLKCNILANKNRNEWREYFQEKLSKLYNYQYEEIMKNVI